jgi:DNA-directed RNA polymerase specialized sigma24 family protein
VETDGTLIERSCRGRADAFAAVVQRLTPAQAAATLGVPPGTARSRLHRARSALRLALKEEH